MLFFLGRAPSPGSGSVPSGVPCSRGVKYFTPLLHTAPPRRCVLRAPHACALRALFFLALIFSTHIGWLPRQLAFILLLKPISIEVEQPIEKTIPFRLLFVSASRFYRKNMCLDWGLKQKNHYICGRLSQKLDRHGCD